VFLPNETSIQIKAKGSAFSVPIRSYPNYNSMTELAQLIRRQSTIDLANN